MFRYVLKKEDGFFRWIQWTAGVVPSVRTAEYEQAMIVSDEYLNYEVEKTGKTRRELIEEYHPGTQFVKVQITIVES
ncbi:hypothetical protein CVD28_00900 [Bacillus sp. M6-12]|uniref:hypothetical protein n=1 Tax=Bacillus sp. M6-12 TaxID=2054166 RepID=UPI000C77AA1E|nr:hypothetical protein [Bacillus sp. M6-12]PLS18991.1 hypothetical protein CVD28_00900 [Bacillus sp. M6-12]